MTSPGRLRRFLQTPWVSGAIGGFVAGILAAALLWANTNVGPAADVITALAKLLWPIGFIVVMYWYEDDISKFLARLQRGKLWGGEVELAQGMTTTATLVTNTTTPDTVSSRSATELKILNTLWTHQALRFPKLDSLWTFGLSPSSPKHEVFQTAANKLLTEGLIHPTDNGQYVLSKKGLIYCKNNHQHFPQDRWWPADPLEPDKIRELINSVANNLE